MLKLLLLFVFLSTTSFAGGDAISKARLISGLREGLARTFCEEKTFFRKCFSISNELCEKTTKEGLESCLKQLETKLPEKLKQPDEGESWGQQFGACTGKFFETTLEKSKIESADCKNPDKWTGSTPKP